MKLSLASLFSVLFVATCLLLGSSILLGGTAHAQCDSLNPDCTSSYPNTDPSHGDYQGSYTEAGGDAEPAVVFLTSPGGMGGASVLESLDKDSFFENVDFGDSLADYGVPTSQLDQWTQGAVESADQFTSQVYEDAWQRHTLPQSNYIEFPISTPVSQGPIPKLSPKGEFLRTIQEKMQTDPVSFYNGELYIDVTDLSFPSFGIGYSHRRSYRSRVNYDGPMGHGWDHSYNRRLVLVPDSQAAQLSYAGAPDTAELPALAGIPNLSIGQAELLKVVDSSKTDAYCGHKIMLLSGTTATLVFREVGSEGDQVFYESEAQELTLRGIRVGGDFTWTLSSVDGTKEEFDINGLLVSQVDRNELGVEVLWEPTTNNADWRVLSVVDSVNRTVD